MLCSWNESISELIFNALVLCQNTNELPEVCDFIDIKKIRSSISKPRDKENGDISSNIIFFISKKIQLGPNQLASILQEKINELILNKEEADFENNIIVEKVKYAPPGFINFWISAAAKFEVVAQVISDEEFGFIKSNKNQKILLEFVSANPTGPLHVGHARQAVLGDSIAKILVASGASVHKEFYYNDAGNQIENLMLSVKARLKRISPEDSSFPKDGYKGDYINEVCKEFVKQNQSLHDTNDSSEEIKSFSVGYLRKEQNIDLSALSVFFDSFKLESTFYLNGQIENVIKAIEKNNKVYTKDSALWFRSTFYGDDKDRVMRKADGEYTYFVPDIAYHLDKWKRGYGRAINIQGFDHHGTLKRVAAGLQALNVGIENNFPQTILHKMVKVVRDGKEVKISKRSGSFITLRDLICWAGNIKNNEEFVNLINNNNSSPKIQRGRDVVRFFLISKKAETEFTFDVDVAQKQNDENPVFYVQYAFARANSLIYQAGFSEEDLIKYLKNLSKNDFCKIGKLINNSKESLLCMRLAEFPTIFQTATNELAPHMIVFYLRDLAAEFHSYYNNTKINVDNENQKKARLLLVLATSFILKKCLKLLGVTCPKRM